MSTFTLLFIAALLLSLGTRFWLASRHLQHVRTHRDAVPAAFAANIDLEAHRKAADYSVAKTKLNRLSFVVDALILLALTLGGVLQWLDTVARHVIGDGLMQQVLFLTMLTVLLSLVDLPFSLYRTFRVEARFGFNKMTLAMFLKDMAKQAMIGAALGLPLACAVLWLMAAMGGLWWLYVWLLWVAFNSVVLALYPTLIAPLFNKFTPLENGALKARVEQLLAKCGFASKGLYVMDGSARSTHGNAYFTGFGNAKRIVFFDTLLNRLEHSEIEAVIAHELGHFRMRHVLRRMAWTFAVSLMFLWVLGLVKDQAWFYIGLGVASPATDAMALTLFFTAAPVFVFLLRPLAAMYSRKHEFEADQYAAKFADAGELVRALVKLYKDNASTLTPDPLHSAFYDSHPPALTRITRLQQFASGRAV
jgi:STE24 endopeptidase